MPDHETSLEQFGVPRPLIGREPKNIHSLKCKNCNKFFAENITTEGQLVYCPECHTAHVIHIIYRAVLPAGVGA